MSSTLGTDVFLCHSSADKDQVRELYFRLKADGVTCWFDEEDLLPGQNWQLEIRKALKASRFILACLSNGSIAKTGYIQKELRDSLALAAEQPEGSIFLIPLRLEDCVLPASMADLHWVDLFRDRGYSKLLRVLKSASFNEQSRKVEGIDSRSAQDIASQSTADSHEVSPASRLRFSDDVGTPSRPIEIDVTALGKIGPIIGQGGEGAVYELPSLRLPDTLAHLVYKHYKQRPVDGDRLTRLIAMRHRLVTEGITDERLNSLAAWPLRLVKESDDIVGIVLPGIPDAYISPHGRPWAGLQVADRLFIPADSPRRRGLPDYSTAIRFTICRDLAALVAFFHDPSIDLILGDVINERNVLYRVQGRPAVMIVDCDSLRPRGISTGPNMETLGWIPPEGGFTGTREADVYKLGLFILGAICPARDSACAKEVLGDDGFRMLVATLGDSPDARPSADEWLRYFDSARAGEFST